MIEATAQLMVFKRLFEVLIARKFRNGNLFSDVIIDKKII